MSMVNIFTRYEKEENHLTNGLISILNMSRLDGPHFLTSFLQGALGLSPNVEVDTFRVLRGQEGAWDGEICGKDFCVLFETKIVSGTLRPKQVRGHLQRLKCRSEKLRKLVLLTPDDSNSSYIREHRSLNASRIVHLGWKRVYSFLGVSVTGRTPCVFTELVHQFLDRIRDMVFKEDIAGVILKIYFGDKSEVYEDRYLAEMKSGKWKRWNTPRKYKNLDGTGRKLLLYDGTRKGITVEVEIKKVKRTDTEPDYPWTNLFAPDTLHIFEPAIALSSIRGVAGFENFGVHKKDRSPYRNITHEQYRELKGEVSTTGIGTTTG